nr:hypothetical protein [Tanacetum cinerariifolium]
MKIKKTKRRGSTEKVLGEPKATARPFPFIKALTQMPKYAKILKDLGASISLMTYTMYEKLDLGEPKDTRMSLKLADRSIQYPRGIIENVLIKVDKFVLLIDFVIIDMPEDSRVPIILGIPFLATARAMMDVFNKKITLRVGDDEVIFNMDQSIKRSPAEDDECYEVDDLNVAINVEAQELLANNMSDSFLLKGLKKSIDQSNLESCELFKCKAVDDSDLGEPIRRIESVNTSYLVAQKIAEPNKVESEQLYSASANEIDEKKPELKFFPQHLEYAYLHGDKYFPINISSKLSIKEKMLLLQVLEKQKGGNCLENVKHQGNQSVILHTQDSNGRLLQINSSWVSPIHVVPKKGGMIVVLNDNNELILSRFFQILIAPKDQEKTTFTCPYGTFAYRRMPFGLCNAPANFQRCMIAIFHDMVKDFMEVFMDVFLAFNILKEKLTTAAIVISPDWNVPFELMCDASDFTIGAVAIGVPKALISDPGTHFCNSQLKKALQKYRVTHKLSTAYHPQTNRQTEITNRAIKCILERLVGYNLKNWYEKLDDALWAFRTTYKTPTGCTPFRLVYGKACYLPVEIEHKAYWALKQRNMDLTAATKNRFMELNELTKLRDEAYENTRIYKERTKTWYNARLHGDKNFKVGDKVLLFNFRLKKYHDGHIDVEDKVVKLKEDTT